MKIVIFTLAVAAIISGCDKPKNPAAEYGETMVHSYQKGQQAGDTANLDAVRKSVQAYNAANDKYPQTLDEIKPLLNSEIDLSKFDYDPKTGKVNLKAK